MSLPRRSGNLDGAAKNSIYAMIASNFSQNFLLTSLSSSHLQAIPTLKKPAHKWIVHINPRKNLWAGWILHPGGKETTRVSFPPGTPLSSQGVLWRGARLNRITNRLLSIPKAGSSEKLHRTLRHSGACKPKSFDYT
jgi:hypothetical protein